MRWTDGLKDFFHRQSAPKNFYATCGQLLPWFVWPAVLLMLAGLVVGWGFAPLQAGGQFESYRIIYIHVPAATLSLMVYVYMAIAAAVGLIWHIKVAEITAFCCAPVGAWFTLLALVTGSIWGKPTWGTWWQWDARMTSELVLLFLYMGLIGLGNAIEDRRSAANATAILTLSGVVLIPFIYLSVDPKMGFNTLHQGITEFSNPKVVDPRISWAVRLMILSFLMYFAVSLLLRIRNEILYRDRNTQWVKQMVRDS